MEFKKPDKKDLIKIFLLIGFTMIATFFYGSRGFFVGFVIIYLNALIDVAKQLPEIEKKHSKKRVVIIVLYFTIVTIAVFFWFYKTMW